MTAPPTVVVWEDTGKETVVRSWCKRCYPDGPEDIVMLVSPRGVVHHVSDYRETDCGKDATGPDWWWRL